MVVEESEAAKKVAEVALAPETEAETAEEVEKEVHVTAVRYVSSSAAAAKEAGAVETSAAASKTAE